MLTIEELRQQVVFVERQYGELVRKAEPGAPVSTGHEEIDAALGGGFARGRLHETFSKCEDMGSATLFASMVAARCTGPVFWLREGAAERRSGRLYGPGLEQLGLHPDRLVMVLTPDARELLRAAADCVAGLSKGLIIAELWGDPRVFDLTASRKLALMAGDSGALLLMLRINATPAPSAAWTRWTVGPARSVPRYEHEPGLPAMTLDLTRNRHGGEERRWLTVWDYEARLLVPREAVPPCDSQPYVNPNWHSCDLDGFDFEEIAPDDGDGGFVI